MARARRKRDRLHQIHRWLQATFVTHYPTRLRVEVSDKEDSAGSCEKGRRVFVLRVSPRLTLNAGIDALLHEYAHAMSWPPGPVAKHVPDHSDEWALAYGRLYRAFIDEGAQDFESCDH